MSTLTSSTSWDSTDYHIFYNYYNLSFNYEPNKSIPDKDKIIVEDPPKKEKIHIFDLKDLVL